MKKPLKIHKSGQWIVEAVYIELLLSKFKFDLR